MSGNQLKPGAFYWVWPTLDPDAEDWENRKQPARYAGSGLWQVIGSDEASDWPMQWVGDEISA